MLRTCLKSAAAGLALLAGVAATQSPVLADPLVDVTVAGPVGGAEICVLANCAPEVLGVANLRVVVDAGSPAATPPAVTMGLAPGCTANVNKAVFVTTPGVVGITITPTVTFDRTDKNGNVVGSETLGGTPVPLPPVPGVTLPLFSICATVL